MEVIRKIIDNSGHEVVIPLPENYQRRKLEVIVLPIEEEKEPDKKFDFSDLYGKLDWKGDAVAEQRKLRDEWD